MIIWRGWGIVAVLLLAGGGLLGALVGGGRPAAVGIGILLGSVACWFAGQRLNVIGPAKKAANYAQGRSVELHTAADNGTFHLGPGHTAPTSLQQAHAQADQLLAAEVASITERQRNQHTLFFIPVQYWAAIGAVGAALVAVGVLK